MLFQIDREKKAILNPDAVKICPVLKDISEQDLYFKSGKVSCVYLINNKINGDKYIGSAVDFERRKAIHVSTLNNKKHHSFKLQRAWNEYGSANFEFNIIRFEYPNDLLKLEQVYLDSYNPEYNINKLAHSRLGVKASDETKRKISLSKKGKRRPPVSNETRKKLSELMIKFWIGRERKFPSKEVRLKISLTHKGKKKTLDHRMKISIANIGRKENPVVTEKRRQTLLSKKTKLTDAQKENLRVKFTGRFVSEETRRRMSVAFKGRVYSEESKKRISEAGKLSWAKRKEKLKCYFQ